MISKAQLLSRTTPLSSQPPQYQSQPVDPKQLAQYQEVLASQQQTVSKLQQDMTTARTAREQVDLNYKALVDRLALSGEGPNRNDSERYLAQREAADASLRAISSTLQAAQVGGVTYAAAQKYISDYTARERQAQSTSARYSQQSREANIRYQQYLKTAPPDIEGGWVQLESGALMSKAAYEDYAAKYKTALAQQEYERKPTLPEARAPEEIPTPPVRTPISKTFAFIQKYGKYLISKPVGVSFIPSSMESVQRGVRYMQRTPSLAERLKEYPAPYEWESVQEAVKAVKYIQQQQEITHDLFKSTPSPSFETAPGDDLTKQTMAVDVGEGMMQDIVVFSDDGRFVRTGETRGPEFPHSERFIEKGRVGKTPKEIFESELKPEPEPEKPKPIREFFFGMLKPSFITPGFTIPQTIGIVKAGVTTKVLGPSPFITPGFTIPQTPEIAKAVGGGVVGVTGVVTEFLGRAPPSPRKPSFITPGVAGFTIPQTIGIAKAVGGAVAGVVTEVLGPPSSPLITGRKKEYEVFEPKGKEVISEIKKVEVARTLEQQQEIHRKLEKDYGVIAIPTYDPEKDITYYRYKFPEWFKQLRPKFAEKKEKETLVPFFLRKLRYGTEVAVTDIYQRAVYQGPGLSVKAIREPLVYKTPTSAKYVGKGVAIGLQLGMTLTIPGALPVSFLGGTTEAITRGRKRFIGFAKEEPLEVGLAATYGLGKAYQFLKYARQPVYITGAGKISKKSVWIEKPKIKSAKYREVHLPIYTTKAGKVLKRETLVQYRTVTTFSPGKYKIQPRWEKWIGRKPTIKIYKPQPRVASTLLPVKVGAKKFTTAASRGKKPTVATWEYVRGGKVTSRREKWLAQQYKATWGEGQQQLVPQEFAVSIAGKKGRVMGFVETEKFAKYYPKKGRVDILTQPIGTDFYKTGKIVKFPTTKKYTFEFYGKTVKLDKPPTIIVKFPTTKKYVFDFYGKTVKVAKPPTREVYKTRLIYKDISKAGPRATGKVFPLSGTTTVLQPKVIEIPTKGISVPEFVTKFEKTPSQIFARPEFRETLSYVNIPKQIFKIPSPKFFPKPPVIIPTFSLPKIKVSQTLIRKAGEKFELIISTDISAVTFAPKISQILAPKIDTRLDIRLDTIPKTKPIIKSTWHLPSRIVTKPITKLITKQIIKPITRQITRPITRQLIRPITRLITRQVTRPKPPISFGFGLPIPSPSRLRIIPKRPTKIIPGLFIGEVRRRGKWKPITRPVPFGVALRISKERVKRTLAVSLRIAKAGTEEFVGLVPTAEFRKGKKGKDPFILIQRKRRIGFVGGRLSSPGEKREIQRARRRARKQWWN